MGRASLAPIRKKEILEHFYEVLMEEGIEGASIIKVAGRMGVYPSHVSHYFPTKEQLVVELVNFLVDRYEADFAASLYSRARGARRLSGLLDTLFSLEWAAGVDSRAFYGVYYLSLRNEGIYKSLANMYERFRGHLVSVLEECKVQGVVGPVDTEQEAHNIIAMVEGLDFYTNLCRDPDKTRSVGKACRQMIWARLVPGSRA